jgi:hypothetical protein
MLLVEIVARLAAVVDQRLVKPDPDSGRVVVILVALVVSGDIHHEAPIIGRTVDEYLEPFEFTFYMRLAFHSVTSFKRVIVARARRSPVADPWTVNTITGFVETELQHSLHAWHVTPRASPGQ